MPIDNIIVIAFLIILLISIHTYLFYPLSMMIISKFFKKVNNDEEYQPSCSILISAYNEEKVIKNRVLNIANQNYDLTKIEVIIGSDCSSDKTNDYLKELAERYSWLKVRLFNERRGKAAVINDIAKEAKYNYLVFTDANTEFDSDALKILLSNFKNPDIGGVCGRLKLAEKDLDSRESVEEKKYWDYETYIKKYEGKCGVLIGANGGIFAIRKELFRDIPIKKAVTDDFFISLSVLAQNYKFIYVENSFAIEEVGMDISHEMKRKIRFSATNYQTISFFRNLLFYKNFLISYAFWSHKIIRWIFPLLLVLLFLFNLFLKDVNTFFSIIFLIQIIFYLFAFIGYILSKLKVRLSIFSLPYFFMITNIALVIGFIKYLSKKHSVIWQSTPR